MAQRTIRLPEPLPEQIAQEARRRGYASTSAFIRAAIQNELNRTDVRSNDQQAEPSRIQQALTQLRTGQQAEIGLLDELIRVILYCVAEPPMEQRAQASALANERHERLLTRVAHQMQGNARQVLEEFVGHEQ